MKNERRSYNEWLKSARNFRTFKTFTKNESKQLKKLKEIIVEIEATTERLENLINDFNKLF